MTRHALAALLLLTPGLARAQDTLVAVTNVTVIDPSNATASARAGQTVVVRNGTIIDVGPVARVAIPRNARRIDATGKFMIPGLWDAHVHFMNTGPNALPMYVALGVTSVREMGGYLDSTRAWQQRMSAGTMIGPRILTPGPVLESPRYLQRVRDRSLRDPRLGQRILPYRVGVGNAADARRVIDSLVGLRVDFVKIRTTDSPEAYFAILRESRRAGLAVAGHLPSAASIGVAADSGQTDIEHALAPPLSRQSQAFRDSVYRHLVKNGTWYTPTLIVARSGTLSGAEADSAISRDSRSVYASPWLREWWSMQTAERALDTSAAGARSAMEMYRSSTSDLRAMQDAGVRILAGSDAGSVYVYPGFAVHDELALMVNDGRLTPREALWSATVGPAEFARLDARLGTIARGKIADFVLLNANPLARIENTQRIHAVMSGGRYYTRVQLDALLAGAATSAATPP